MKCVLSLRKNARILTYKLILYQNDFLTYSNVFLPHDALLARYMLSWHCVCRYWTIFGIRTPLNLS